MEEIHKNILISIRDQITDDVNVNYGILHFLQQDNILTDGDIKKINSPNDNPAKAKILLSVLPNCGPNAFTSFYTSLKPRYPWLCKSIDNKMKDMERKKNNHNFDTTRMCRSPVLPLPPQLEVSRDEKIEELKQALNQLQPDGYVVLHGMKGYGKSCLAVTVLQDRSIVRNLFNNTIYWIKFGYKNDVDDEIWIQLSNLYCKVKNLEYPLNYSTNSERGKTKVQQKENMCNELRQYFSTCNQYQKSLLVLDDVWHSRMIETFDFQCKKLVITTDINLLNHQRSIVIQMKDGFTEEESLKLFSSALNTSVGALPHEAKEIHKECGGMPILIAMFAAEIKEYHQDMKINRDRWRYYLDAIRQKDVTNRLVEPLLEKQKTIFNMCIDRLKGDELLRYKNLAIFSEDVNITPKTLAILWIGNFESATKCIVEDLMLDLCNKSLAVKQWNADLNSYIYGVHELLVSHLRKKISDTELVTMHREFVKKYFTYCNNDLSKLPADNYSYSYIGYHLEQANMYNEFQRVFLDFGFIQGKIYNSGVNDLLLDLKKYRQYIVMNDNHFVIEDKIVDLEKFIKDQAKAISEYRQRDCLNLVQLALNSNNRRGYMFQKAQEIANASHHLYLLNHNQKSIEQRSSPLQSEDHYHSVMLTELCTVNFTDNPRKIIIGGKSGKLSLWDCDKEKNTFAFHGFDKNSTITKVIVSHDGSFFIALNNKSIIKQFNLSIIDELDSSSDSCTEKTSPAPTTPQEKQSFWSEMHCKIVNNSIRTYICNEVLNVTDIALSCDDQRIAACTSTGIIKIWDVNTGNEIDNVFNKLGELNRQSFQLITFSNKKNLIAINTIGIIVVFEWNGNSYVYKCQYNPMWKYPNTNVNDTIVKDEDWKDSDADEIKVIYFREKSDDGDFVYITETKALRVFFRIFASGDLVSPDTRPLVNTNNDNVKFVAATLTHDGQYLIISDTEDRIKIWEINTYFEPKAVYSERSTTLDTYWDTTIDDNECCHLIISGHNHYIQRLTFKSNLTTELRQFTHDIPPVFDAIIMPNDDDEECYYIVAQQIDENRVGLFFGHDLQSASEPTSGKITSIMLNTAGNKIVFTTDTGDVHLYDTNNKKTSRVVSLRREYLNFARFIDFHSSSSNTEFIVCRNADHLIVIDSRADVFTAQVIDNAGRVVGLHNINNKYAITVAEDEKIMIWEMDAITIVKSNESTANQPHYEILGWKRLWPTENINSNNDIIVCYSCLSPDNNYLAVLKSNFELMIYTVMYNSPDKIQQYSDNLNFSKKLTCCAFSSDSKLLAIGAADGEILVLNVSDRTIYDQQKFHCNAVLQLHWAPQEIGLPILFSVNTDELAWWRISSNNTKRRSRIGLTRSLTLPLSASEITVETSDEKRFGASCSREMRNSLTLNIDFGSAAAAADQSLRYENLNIHNNNVSNNTRRLDKYWSSRISPYGKKWPLLLGLIKLPPECWRCKVCVSSDFSKFLLVDINGTVNTFKLFQY